MIKSQKQKNTQITDLLSVIWQWVCVARELDMVQ